jgi:transcription antitermination protein NusB
MKNEEYNDQEKKNESAYDGRTKARQILVQMLYEWSAGHSSAQQVFDYRSSEAMDADYTYLKSSYFLIVEQQEIIDGDIAPLLDRDISRLGLVELSILRLSTFELKNLLEVPYKVVLNEAVELAKTFGAQDSHKYVNAVLDKLARQLRSTEM